MILLQDLEDQENQISLKRVSKQDFVPLHVCPLLLTLQYPVYSVLYSSLIGLKISCAQYLKRCYASSDFPIISGVTRGGRLAHPWKILGRNFEGEGEKKGARKREEREKKREEEKGEEKKGKGKKKEREKKKEKRKKKKERKERREEKEKRRERE